MNSPIIVELVRAHLAGITARPSAGLKGMAGVPARVAG
jgi:hypothetical protein